MLWYILALGSAIFSTLAALTEKKTLIKVHAMEFSCALAIVNFLLTLPFLSMADFNIPIFVLAVMYASSIIATIAFLFIAKAVRHLEISLVSPLLNLNPAILATLAYFILGERITHAQIAGILMIMAGAYIVEINWQKHSIFEPVKAMFSSRHTRYILLSCLLYSISSICDKFALNYVTPITYLLIIQFFIAINFTILINLFYGGFKDISIGFRHAGKSIFLIAFFTISYRLLQAWAVSLTLVSLVIPIKRLSTLFSTLAGGRLFHEKGTKRKAIACIIMLAGAYLIIA